MYTDLGSMFTSYPPAARGLLPCMQPAVGPGGYSPQTQIFGTQEGENKPPCAITFHGELRYDMTYELFFRTGIHRRRNCVVIDLGS